MNYRFVSCFLALVSGCASEDIPQAHKGRMFGHTGALILYGGKVGFYGEVLGPGTVYTGVYDNVKMIDCATKTKKETLAALTKDQVHFDSDVYVTYRANCDDNATIVKTLESMSPAKGDSIEGEQLYETFIRNSMGEALRLAVAPINAFDINSDRQKIHDAAEIKFFGIWRGSTVALTAIQGRKQKTLPEKDTQCACPVDDEGYVRCEGRADPRCQAGNCSLHCAKFCEGRCKETEVMKNFVEKKCGSPCSPRSSIRCDGLADPRCKGGNCTSHCKEHCGGGCLRGLRAIS